MASSRIHSYVRCRPVNRRETDAGEAASPPLQCTGNTVTVNIAATGRAKVFSPDVVFDPSATQKDVYEAVAVDMEDDVLDGYNCVLFAYGQTGTGKTFTMEGDITSDAVELGPNAGLVARTACSMFSKLEERKARETALGGASAFQYRVEVSAVELYNEEFKDCILGYHFGAGKACHSESTLKKSVEKAHAMAQSAKLTQLEARAAADGASSGGRAAKMPKVKVDGKGALVNETRVECATHGTIIDLLRYAQLQRATASTNMNATSSRSHFVLQIVVNMTSMAVGESAAETRIKRGKLFLVDLAGSECASRSGVTGKGAREMKNINKSNEALKVRRVAQRAALAPRLNSGDDSGDVAVFVVARSRSTHRRPSFPLPSPVSSLPSPLCPVLTPSPCYPPQRVIESKVANAGHIPYRDSKLTRILEPALGGSAKTRIIGTVSPCASGLSESQSTLRYVCMAKQIKNCPVKCQEVSKQGVDAAMTKQCVLGFVSY
jgi:hypothetical protein